MKKRIEQKNPKKKTSKKNQKKNQPEKENLKKKNQEHNIGLTWDRSILRLVLGTCVSQAMSCGQSA